MMPYGHSRTAYKTPIGVTLFCLIYSKACHLPAELEHKAFWAIKALNFDVKTTEEKSKLQLHELDELGMDAYESARLYKEQTKCWHDKQIFHKEFWEEELVLLFNSIFKLF